MSISPKKLTVVHCLPNLGVGGAQRGTVELMTALEPHGVESHLVVVGSSRTTIEWPYLPGKPVFLNYSGSHRDVWGFRRTTQRLRSILCELDAEILHSHLWPAAQVGGWAVDPRTTQHLVHIRDTQPWVASNSLRGRVLRRWTRSTMQRSRAAYVSVSQAAWDYNARYLRLDASCQRVIRGGLNLDAFRPLSRPAKQSHTHPIRVGFAARFSQVKGHKLLIQAAAELRRRGFDLEVHLAGDGSQVQPSRLLAATLGLSDRIHFPGIILDVPSFLRGLDVFVLPSTMAEGLPRSVFEAMATQLPVVATDVAGTSEIVENDRTGLLIPPSDVGALVTALERVITDPPLRERLALNGARLVRENYSWAAVAEQVVEFYKQILQSRGHAPEPGLAGMTSEPRSAADQLTT